MRLFFELAMLTLNTWLIPVMPSCARGADILIRGEKDAVNRAGKLIKSVLKSLRAKKNSLYLI